MFDHDRLNEILVDYKANFEQKQWPDEKYKWIAVKRFQDVWDINAEDFGSMLGQALDKCGNLLASAGNFPARMIIEFAKERPEDVRSMFIGLFDETRDYYERIAAFKATSADVLRAIHGDDTNLNHYQDENTITTYLWLRFPDRYYIYKYSEVRSVADELGSDCVIKKGAYASNVRNHLAFYDEICAALKQDSELVSLLKSNLTSECYPDPELRTLTIDVGFYISRYVHDQPKPPQTDDWFPAADDYDPGLSVDDWRGLLADDSVFTESALEIVCRMADFGGQATCKQLASRYGETANFYLSGSVALAKRIASKTECPVMPDDAGNSKWWPVLFTGRAAEKAEEGSWVWRLRDELREALGQADTSGVRLNTVDDNQHGPQGFWWLNASPKIWSFSDIAVGEAQPYTLLNENGRKRRIYQNFLDAKAGDMVIGYESNPVKQVVAIGRIASEQDGEKLDFEKVEGLSTPIDYKTLRDCPELANMEYFSNPRGTLFRLTPDEYDFILDLIREENPVPQERKYDHYGKAAFLEDVYMDEARYDKLRAVLLRKKNVILQGAPGVGKTFCARRLAWSIMGEKDDSRIEFVQFHQSYSYEDFVGGWRPEEEGFAWKPGVFYRFCKKAENQPGKPFFFIIDEINRGNLSRIFGELLMLIEADYRDGAKVTLPYGDAPFSVPGNVYIIGMMNTADRSLAMIDYALRRRFSFFDMGPAFGTEGFTKYRESLGSETVDDLVTKVEELNEEISRDGSLGKGFRIGHSYFCGHDAHEDADDWCLQVVDFEILPMLSEYWFDDESKVMRWDNALHGVFQR